MQQSFTLDELYSATFADELFLVKPFMPQGGHCLLHGKRGLGKTQLATTLAIDVALGQPFLGTFPTTQATVLYVQADMTPRLQQERVQRLVDNTGLDKRIPLHYMIFPGSIDIEAQLESGAAWLADIAALDPGLVIIDTLRKSHNSDENVSNTPVEVYGWWRAAVGPRATLLYIHHDRKTSEYSRGGDRDEEFRGSGAWLDEADLGMHLCSAGGGLFVEWSKLRTCAPEQCRPVTLRMDSDTLLMVADNPVEAYIIDAMRRGLPREQILAEAQNERRWGQQAMSRATAFRRLQGYRAADTPRETGETVSRP